MLRGVHLGSTAWWCFQISKYAYLPRVVNPCVPYNAVETLADPCVGFDLPVYNRLSCKGFGIGPRLSEAVAHLYIRRGFRCLLVLTILFTDNQLAGIIQRLLILDLSSSVTGVSHPPDTLNGSIIVYNLSSKLWQFVHEKKCCTQEEYSENILHRTGRNPKEPIAAAGDSCLSFVCWLMIGRRYS